MWGCWEGVGGGEGWGWEFDLYAKYIVAGIFYKSILHTCVFVFTESTAFSAVGLIVLNRAVPVTES